MNTRKLKLVGIAAAYAASLVIPNMATAGDEESAEMEGKHGYLGVYVESVPALASSQLGLEDGVGVVVEKIVQDGPAEKAGLKKHDILLKFDEQILIGTKQIIILVRNSEVGSEHKITYLRGGKESKATVTIGESKKKESKIKKEQSFFQFPDAPMSPEHPAPVVSFYSEQARSQQALDRARQSLEEARSEHERAVEAMHSEEFVRQMEWNEEMEVLVQRVTSATQNLENVSMPTVVFNGPEHVFEFSDDDGNLYCIIDKNGNRELSIIDAGGKETYSGKLDKQAEELLPEKIREKLPKFAKIIEVKPMVWTNERGIETF